MAAAAAGMVLAGRRRGRLARGYANPALVATGLSARTRTLRIAAAVAALLALTSGIVAMAEPAVERTGRQQRGTVFIAIDTSKSMQKTDITPTRLGAALDAARRFVRQKPDRLQVGLVAFNKSADVVQPPTTDRATLLDALSKRFTNIGTGTAIGDAVVSSLAGMRAAGLTQPASSPEQSSFRMLLLSDGAQFLGTVSPSDAAVRAHELAVPVYTILLGDDAGLPNEPTPRDTLGGLASTTGGRFAQTATADDLKKVFADMGASLVPVRRLTELSAIPAGVGALLLLGAAALMVAAGTGRRTALVPQT
ncbi:MAG: VWA domain-containing protein [Thermoleophilia bacterium]